MPISLVEEKRERMGWKRCRLRERDREGSKFHFHSKNFGFGCFALPLRDCSGRYSVLLICLAVFSGKPFALTSLLLCFCFLEISYNMHLVIHGLLIEDTLRRTRAGAIFLFGGFQTGV